MEMPVEESLNNYTYDFFEGDTVCYCERHYEYLKDIARWPSIHIPREALSGVVTNVTHRHISVRWSPNADPVCHLPSNLELVTSSGEEK